MKKFNSIQQLQPEKKRVKRQQEVLENRIRGNWNELKESLKPVNIAKDAFSSVIRYKTRENWNDDSVVKSAFSYGASLLAKRIADKAGKKLARLLKK